MAKKKKAKKKVKKAKKKAKKKRKPNAAFMAPVKPDAKLAVIVGAKPLPRTELTKKLFDIHLASTRSTRPTPCTSLPDWRR